jgi:hypothetical protein
VKILKTKRLNKPVIPAEAGIQLLFLLWIPVFTGMTLELQGRVAVTGGRQGL